MTDFFELQHFPIFIVPREEDVHSFLYSSRRTKCQKQTVILLLSSRLSHAERVSSHRQLLPLVLLIARERKWKMSQKECLPMAWSSVWVEGLASLSLKMHESGTLWQSDWKEHRKKKERSAAVCTTFSSKQLVFMMKITTLSKVKGMICNQERKIKGDDGQRWSITVGRRCC